jgi:hypothetical protein
MKNIIYIYENLLVHESSPLAFSLFSQHSPLFAAKYQIITIRARKEYCNKLNKIGKKVIIYQLHQCERLFNFLAQKKVPKEDQI